MPTVLCFNPGSNSLKFDLVEIARDAARAGEGRRLLAGMIDNIGKESAIEITRGEEKIASKKVEAGDFGAGVAAVLDELSGVAKAELEGLALVAVRVVHGGGRFTEAVRFDDGVRKEIEALEELAPLHNANSLKIIDVVQKQQPEWAIAVAFDTAFHATLPEKAWRYGIDRKLADKHGIRKFGFHGISHRYMLEQYAHLAGRPKEEVTIVTMHLESGSSVAAIERGRSVETSMGFTPLEGLMMGTRSGSVDPAILPYLMKHEGLSSEDALNVLEKKSGMLGISGVSLDTRVLEKRSDEDSRLALEMFGYRVRQTVGAYLAVLGSAEAIVFGGGIGENSHGTRKMVCDGLDGWGVRLDDRLNETVENGDVCLSLPESKLALWAIHSDEAMQLAHECAQVL
ncbi:acetate kinase [Granulicella aggregans]|uniref:Acetate kinase n=1 Tax=Granulicella aggregans TaxID=474949 RepID=A0A7W8E2I8_9BACT|nr:acetate/propionate family kinase [Granulicella aggregans]MBB5056416.1 acetate kinase [Granulicella aggregans]